MVSHLRILWLYRMTNEHKSMGEKLSGLAAMSFWLLICPEGPVSIRVSFWWGHGNSMLWRSEQKLSARPTSPESCSQLQELCEEVVSGLGSRERCVFVTNAQQGLPRWRWKQKHSCALVKGLAFGLISSTIFMNGLGTIIGMHRNALIKLFDENLGYCQCSKGSNCHTWRTELLQ